MQPSDADPPGTEGPPKLRETPVERICQLLCGVGLFAMIAIVTLEVITRNLFGFSFQISDELGGYIIVLISFLSLCVCQVNQSFHHVEFLQARLSRRGRAASRVVFDLICLVLCGILLWQMIRLTLNSFASEDVAPTPLMTPLWLPQALMPLGLAALTFSVARITLADLRALR